MSNFAPFLSFDVIQKIVQLRVLANELSHFMHLHVIPSGVKNGRVIPNDNFWV